MNQQFEAIFEQGVLRPLEPIALRENEVVRVSVVSARRDEEAERLLGDKQRNLLLSFVAMMESVPRTSHQGGFSNRNHDQAIYGGST